MINRANDDFFTEQLQKMGILPSPKSHDKATSANAKRRSVPTDFASLKPLRPGGALGFSTFRDTGNRSTSHGGAKKLSKDDSDMDSDEDDVDVGKGKSVKQEDADIQESGVSAMSADDVKRQGELAEGVQKIRVYYIFNFYTTPLFLSGSCERMFGLETDSCVFDLQLKRQHSADLLNAMSPATRRSPASNTPTGGSTPPHILNSTASPAILFPPGSSGSIFDLETPRAFDETNIGSPLKKQRASVAGLDDEAMKRRLGLGLSGVTGADVLSQIDKEESSHREEETRLTDEVKEKAAAVDEDESMMTNSSKNVKMSEDEEL